MQGCSDLTGSNKPPILVGPPLEFVDPCKGPMVLPEKELSQFEVEQLWMRDRVNLSICRSRHLSLTRFYEFRDRILRGEDE